MRNCFSCGTLTAENAEKKTGIGAVIGAPRGQAIHDNNVTGNYYINGDKPFGNNNGNGRGDLINNKKITISVSSSNDNHGTVSTSYVNPTTNTNTLLQVTATPAAHYHFGSWSDEGEQTHTVGLTDNVNLTATFAPNPYTITVTSADENMGTVSGGGTYDYNSRQTITATPKTGYYFKKWNDGYASASRQVTITCSPIAQSSSHSPLATLICRR